MTPLALIGPIGTTELIILAVIGLLIFGRRLPEVGRSLGKGLVEFKRGLSGVEDEVKKAGELPPPDETRQIANSPPPNAEEDLRAENERLRAQAAKKDQA